MPLVNDDASAAARGRHVVSVGVATRSSGNNSSSNSNISNISSSSSSSTYVADQRHLPPAGHPRARQITLLLPLTTRPAPTRGTPLPDTTRRLLLPRDDPSHPFSLPAPPQSPLGDPKTKPARARRCSPTDRVTRPGILVRAARVPTRRKLGRHRL